MSNPFEHALDLMDRGVVKPENMARMALETMSNSSIESMLRMNDLLHDIPNVRDGKSMSKWVKLLADNPEFNDAINAANAYVPPESDDGEYDNLPPEKYCFRVLDPSNEGDAEMFDVADGQVLVYFTPFDYYAKNGYLLDQDFTSDDIKKAESDSRFNNEAESVWEFDGSRDDAHNFMIAHGFQHHVTLALDNGGNDE